MRILFSCTGSAGHLGPLLPVAAACRAAGHDVRIATQRARAGNVERAGFVPAPFDDPPAEAWGAAHAQLAGLDAAEAGKLMMSEVFAGINARAAFPGLVTIMSEWVPDVVVAEPSEVAAPLAAELHGIPAATVSFALAELMEWAMPSLIPAIDRLRAHAGLARDPAGARLRANLVLTATPRSLEPQADESGIHRFRTEPPARTSELPDWWPGNDDPLVYLTFGSVAGSLGLFPALYEAAIRALAPLHARFLVTVGNDADPAALGALPANVHVERWVPQDDVLARAAAMIGHGGYGTTMGALRHGVPQAFVPLFAIDQWINGRRVAARGAGTTLEGASRPAMQLPGEDVLAALPGAVLRLLEVESHRRAARRIGAEMAALPPVETAVAALEGLVSTPLRRAA